MPVLMDVLRLRCGKALCKSACCWSPCLLARKYIWNLAGAVLRARKDRATRMRVAAVDLPYCRNVFSWTSSSRKASRVCRRFNSLSLAGAVARHEQHTTVHAQRGDSVVTF